MDEEEKRWDDELKARERLFCLHYCTNEDTRFNATASYRETYKKTDKETGKTIYPEQATCETNGSKILKKPKIKTAIKMLLKVTQEELDEEAVYKALRDIWLLSTFNPADILRADGSLKTRTLDALGEKAKCIAQITKTQYGTKYTLVDRNKAMSQMLEYLHIIRPEVEQEVKLAVVEMVQKAASPEDWNKLQEQQGDK